MVCFYAFLTGCGGSSGKNPTIAYYNNGNSVTPQTINVNITGNGKVVSTSSPSGKMTLEAPEENTYDSDVLLKITESPSVGNESSLLTVGSIIYGITATKDGSPVSMLSHPLNLTFSNEEKLNSAESYYVGIKDINGGDWQFVNVYSPNLTARASTGSKSQFTYSIYKNNILVALFADLRNILQSTPKVLGVIATLTPSVIPTENSVYTEDLKVNLLLSGENLSGLSADSFKIKVSYLTSDSRDTALKVDGTAVSHIYGSGTNQHGTSGQSYAHQFQFVPLNTKYSAGFAPAITFDINLKDVALSGFPNNFIVEISSNNANSLPFAYSTFLGFTRTGSGTETETETNINTNTDTNTDTDTKAVISLKSPATDFPVEGSKVELEFSEDIAWNDTDKAKITIDNNAVINDYSYSNKVLSLTFKDRLAYNTTYVLNVTDLNGVENATLVFKTANIGTVALKSAATDFEVSNNKIELEFTTDIPWSLADKSKITIDNNVEISDYNYADKILAMTLSKRLKFNTTYLIKVNGLEGVENNTLVLKTESPAQVSLKSPSEDFSVLSAIELEFSKDIPVTNDDISKITLDNKAVISDFSYSNKVLSLRVQGGKLNYNTEYTIMFNGFDAVADNTTLKFKTQSFAGTPTINFSDGMVKHKLNDRVVLQPKFYIDFKKSIASTPLALANIKLNGNDLPKSCTLEFEANMQNAVLSFTEDLEPFTDYTLSIARYQDEDNALINSAELAFKTVPPANITGAGTIDDPFLIYCEAHLRKLNETTPINYLMGNYFFKQMDDITLYEDWVPIGSDYPTKFNGHYNGNNKTISNLSYSGNKNYVGLFGYITNGSVSNLIIRNNHIDGGQYYIGMLCGYINYSFIENIKMEGNNIFTSDSDAYAGYQSGGLIGEAHNSTIRNCQITGKLDFYRDSEIPRGYRGGLVGSIEKCEITNCCVDSPDGIIKGDFQMGGLIGSGYNNNTVTNCYVRIDIESCNSYIGGFAGSFSDSTISNCYSDSRITINTKNDDTFYAFGGLLGQTYNITISNCYASGTLNLNLAKAKQAGTLIGNLGNNSTGNNSFSTVKLKAGDSYTYDGTGDCYNPNAVGTPLWYSYDSSSYVYDSDGTNHCDYGYKTTLDWNTAYWFNLVEGGFPKLIGLPNR